MAQVLQLRRGTTAQSDAFTGAVAEVSVDTDRDSLRVHDGTTMGGKEIAPLNVAIPLLTDATTVNAADELIIQQSGITKRATASELMNNAPVTATGSTTARSLAARAADVVNVKDFGAIGDGVADDTAAIQAAANGNGGKAVYFPSGTYKISQAIVISGSGISLFGDGDSASTIFTTANITMLELDNASTMNNGVISNLGFKAEITGTRTSNIGIRVKSSTAAWFAHWKFDSLRFIGVNTCWQCDTKTTIFYAPSYNVAPVGYLTFSNWHTLANSLGHYPDYGIRFLAGPGAHHTFSNLHISANIYGIAMGNGVQGVGDQLFSHCDFSFCDAGIYINGPTTITEYRERIAVVCCQFDAFSTKACHFIRMRDFRLVGNNLGAIEHILDNCGDYQVDDIEVYQSRYAVRKFLVGPAATTNIFKVDFSQGSLNLSGGNPATPFLSIFIDVYVTGVCGGAGEAWAFYRFAIQWSAGVPTVVVVQNNVKSTNGIFTMSSSVSGSEATFAVIDNGTTATTNFAASIVVNGQFYELTRL